MFCHKEQKHIFPRYAGDEFGWTYGSEEKAVNAEIAEWIRKQILQGRLPKRIIAIR